MGLLLIGIFNAEFLLIGILSVFVRRTVTVGLLLAAITLDIVRGIGSTYRFSPSEMLHSVRYLFGSSPSHLRQVTVIAICVAVVCLLAVFASSKGAHSREREFVVRTLLVFFLFCGVADAVTGHLGSYRSDVRSRIPRLTRFPLHFLVMSGWEHVKFRNSGLDGRDTSVKSASTRLVESWGKPRSADLDGALMRPYMVDRLSERYSVRRGRLPCERRRVLRSFWLSEIMRRRFLQLI